MAGTLPLTRISLNSPLVLLSLIFASNEFIKTQVFISCYKITQGNYLNKSDTEVELEILLIASPIKLEIDKTSIFLAFLIFPPLSIVSVITKFFITEFLIFFYCFSTQYPMSNINIHFFCPSILKSFCSINNCST